MNKEKQQLVTDEPVEKKTSERLLIHLEEFTEYPQSNK